MKKLLIPVVVFLVLVPLAFAAISIDIKVADSFTADETVSFEYTIFTDTNLNIGYVSSINCPSAKSTGSQFKSQEIAANTVHKGDHKDFVIDRNTDQQICKAIVNINSPFRFSQEKAFEIDNLPIFPLDLILCNKSSCPKQSTVFKKNDIVSMDYESPVDNLKIDASLEYPDETSTKIKLPSVLKVTQKGRYTIDVRASKSGYTPSTESIDFSVTDDGLPTGVCNDDGVCDFDETPQDCPSDCVDQDKQFIMIIIGGFFFFMLFSFYFMFSGKQKAAKRRFLLSEYIERNLRKGISGRKIKIALMRSGWSSHEINAAFSLLRSPKVSK
ncbi:MAG: hypothetical protein GY861_09045 [bacterium]|nr:hypothetical protein [bacterium]